MMNTPHNISRGEATSKMAANTTTGITTNRQRIQQHLRDFNFKTLFVEELGWDILSEHALAIPVEGVTYVLRPLVEKRGVKVFVCDPDAEGKIPTDGSLRKIEREVTRHTYEHIVIYVDAARGNQVWQWVKREQGKRLASRMHRYHKGQSGELLAQKLERLAIRLEEEEHLQMTEVAGRVARAFDVERVTKKFYDRFKLEHAAFLNLIGGIDAQADREWYASLMLNRLMFVYFIQRKGFLDTQASGQLDGDPNYLSSRLKRVQQERGEGQFHPFYRYFLLKLFHEGLSQREHAPELEALLGKVPYLNGGLFDVHMLERANPEITIPDEAFEQLFAFLDEFDWYLDDRPLRSDREINPDVLGYIFEKYINQKQMGAYYTKEDITEYIGKHTILPFLLDATEQGCLIAFRPDGPVWSLLHENPDAYIYEAVKKGCDVPLPPEIEAGRHNVAQRGEWNKPAPEAYALPTETWREVVARRTRCQDLRAKLGAGDIMSANDLITHNLDSRRFVEDVITYCTGTDLLRALYDSIEQVTVLDPTCGSGAFLFSALTILEGLYEACLERMQDLVEEREVLDAATPPERLHSSPDIVHFQAILERVKQHPSRAYFIYKSIIIRNLYGVDIMEEATEICKLRLFLKLVSQVDRFEDIEPLPDIDFNIRAGNTLVGFASYEETKRAIEGKTVGKAFQNQMIFDDRLERIERKAQDIERAFEQFRELQTEQDLDPAALAAHKRQLQQMLEILRAELDGYMASDYGIDRNSIPKREEYDARFGQWQLSHHPFHWWIEFYGIMKQGGFDVIIGNPPYLEIREINYIPRTYQCGESGAIHAMCIERGLQILHLQGCMSMIVPLALVSTQRMKIVQELLEARRDVWYSNYSWRPGKLFDTVNRALTIFIAIPSEQTRTFSTTYQKWTADSRDLLMTKTNYIEVPPQRSAFWVPKLENEIEYSLMEKCLGIKTTLSHFMASSPWRVYYRTDGGLYWKVFTDFSPAFQINDKAGHSTRETWFTLENEGMIPIAIATLSSSTFWWWYTVTSNCRHLNPYDIHNFPIPESVINNLFLIELGKKYLEDIQRNSTMLIRNQRQTGRTATQSFKLQKSKPIIDEIDCELAKHYGFTDEELDFIINYDIKYRLGQSSANEEEE